MIPGGSSLQNEAALPLRPVLEESLRSLQSSSHATVEAFENTRVSLTLKLSSVSSESLLKALGVQALSSSNFGKACHGSACLPFSQSSKEILSGSAGSGNVNSGSAMSGSGLNTGPRRGAFGGLGRILSSDAKLTSDSSAKKLSDAAGSSKKGTALSSTGEERGPKRGAGGGVEQREDMAEDIA